MYDEIKNLTEKKLFRYGNGKALYIREIRASPPTSGGILCLYLENGNTVCHYERLSFFEDLVKISYADLTQDETNVLAYYELEQGIEPKATMLERTLEVHDFHEESHTNHKGDSIFPISIKSPPKFSEC